MQDFTTKKSNQLLGFLDSYERIIKQADSEYYLRHYNDKSKLYLKLFSELSKIIIAAQFFLDKNSYEEIEIISDITFKSKTDYSIDSMVGRGILSKQFTEKISSRTYTFTLDLEEIADNKFLPCIFYNISCKNKSRLF